VLREYRLAPEFHALGLRVGAASRCAVDDPASFELRGNAEDREDKLLEFRGRVDHWLRNRAKASARLFEFAGDHKKVGRVTREAVNGGHKNHVARRHRAEEPLELRTVGGRACEFVAERLFAARCLQRGALLGKVLRVGRDAGVAVDQALNQVDAKGSAYRASGTSQRVERH